MISNIQLWLTVGIPSVLILITLFNNNARFNSIETRLVAIENRLVSIEAILWRHEGELGVLKEHVK